MVVFCRECGTKVPENQRFCPTCGAKLITSGLISGASRVKVRRDMGGSIGRKKLEKNEITSGRCESIEVYTDGSRIVRKGSVRLGKGTNQIYLTGIPQGVDAESITLKFPRLDSPCRLQGPESVPVEADTSEIDALKAEKTAFEDQAESCDVIEEALKQNADFRNRTGISLEEAQKYVKDLPAQLMENRKAKREAISKVRELTKKIAELERKNETSVSVLKATVESPVDETFEYELSFLDRGMFWQPFYDIEVSDEKEKVNFKLRCKLFTDTMEDLTDVKIALVNGRSYVSGNCPRISPRRLHILTHEPVRMRAQEARPMAMMMDAAPMMEASAAVGGSYKSAPAPSYAMDKAEVKQEAMTKFVLPGTHTISKDEREMVLDIMDCEVTGEFHYQAAPSMEESVYLTVDIDHVDELDLLECEGNLFAGGSYIGKIDIEGEKTKEKMTLSLGRDSRVEVARKKVRQFRNDGFLKTTQKEVFEYLITVKALEKLDKASCKVRIEDSVPVSEDQEITVEVTESTGAKVEKDGIVTWDLTLNKGEVKELKLNYSISWPKNKRYY